MIISEAAFDATDYFIQKLPKNCFYRRNKELFVSQDRFTKVIKKPLQKQGFLSMKNWFIFIWFYVGRPILIKWWRAFPSRVRWHHDNRYSRCWRVRQYLLEHPLTIPIISFDSIKPRLDIGLYWHQCSGTRTWSLFGQFYKLSRITKKEKPFATVTWLTIPLRNSRSLYCLHLLLI